MRAFVKLYASILLATTSMAATLILPAAAQSVDEPSPVTLEFLREAVADADRRKAQAEGKEFKVEESSTTEKPVVPIKPAAPKGASDHEAGFEAELVESKERPARRAQPKAGAGLEAAPAFDPRDWLQISFVGGSYTPEFLDRVIATSGELGDASVSSQSTSDSRNLSTSRWSWPRRDAAVDRAPIH